ncbi:hypothetical protein PHET_11252 [Paragonimus heterotremus]|uniref:Uncharacterized protein n=1 Tax=Paragonimus heterotremus TaxID=100268 RepID=A0A8J4WDT5_9TREM|nr:hypothetical protein PHET_11252 [Paragonimus heterotremus]
MASYIDSRSQLRLVHEQYALHQLRYKTTTESGKLMSLVSFEIRRIVGLAEKPPKALQAREKINNFKLSKRVFQFDSTLTCWVVSV